MAYFRERNIIKSDYSGHEEASFKLRSRLHRVCFNWISKYDQVYRLELSKLEYQIDLHISNGNFSYSIKSAPYDEVFKALEIFCSLVKKKSVYNFSNVILPDLQKAFDLSRSVYQINGQGLVELRVTMDLANATDNVLNILNSDSKSAETFSKAAGDLFGRRMKPEDIVSDLFISLEDYVKTLSGKKNLSESLKALEKNTILTPHQSSLVEKLSAYRSDSYGVAHSGNYPPPKEDDALWFLRTVEALILLIDGRRQIII